MLYALMALFAFGAIGGGVFLIRRWRERKGLVKEGHSQAYLKGARRGEEAQEAESEAFELRRGRLVERARRRKR